MYFCLYTFHHLSVDSENPDFRLLRVKWLPYPTLIAYIIACGFPHMCNSATPGAHSPKSGQDCPPTPSYSGYAISANHVYSDSIRDSISLPTPHLCDNHVIAHAINPILIWLKANAQHVVNSLAKHLVSATHAIAPTDHC